MATRDMPFDSAAAFCTFCMLRCASFLQNAKKDRLEQRIEVLITERDDAKILAKELKVLLDQACAVHHQLSQSMSVQH